MSIVIKAKTNGNEAYSKDMDISIDELGDRIVDAKDIVALDETTDGVIPVKSGGDLVDSIISADSVAATIDGKVILADSALAETPLPGFIEYDGCRFYITSVATPRAIDRTSDVALETVTVADTAVETVIYTANMEANSLCAGNSFALSASGIISNDSGLAGDQVTIRIKVGGTTIVTLAPEVKAFTDAHWHIITNATQRTIGATGSRASHVHMQIVDADGDGDEVVAVGVRTIDTTANMDVTITAQWASADVANTISLYQGKMKYEN